MAIPDFDKIREQKEQLELELAEAVAPVMQKVIDQFGADHVASIDLSANIHRVPIFGRGLPVSEYLGVKSKITLSL